jgi:cell division protein FtsQ
MKKPSQLWRLLFLSVAIGLLAGVGFAIYALRVEEIRVTGVRTLDPKRVIEVSRLRTGERILWLRLSVVTHRLEGIPAVRSVTVERSLPQTLIIRVRERSPLALLDSRPDLAADAEGRVFPAPSERRLPVLEGWHGKASPGASLDASSREVLNAFEAFPYTIRALTTRISVGPPLMLYLGATEIRFGSLDDLERKARIALAVLQAERGRPLEYIDVRAPSVPVSKRPAPPTPAPTPAPRPRPRPRVPATPGPAATAKPNSSPTAAAPTPGP